HQPKIGFVSLGCPKNLVDSERILTELRTEGYDVVPRYDDADMPETLNFTIDITLMTPTIELAPDQDTGQNKNDNLTSVTQPLFV
ncbi:hypothetical protein ONJ23_26390, partial [Salmonella enterica subsp. enterica serovar Virginia]|nr:hypothetical protein [Salmonella enterica subsp. enterica serovar Virginia]